MQNKDFYTFQTSAALVEIQKTKQYIESQKLGGIQYKDIEETKKNNDKLSVEDVLRKFSDKRIKKKESGIKKVATGTKKVYAGRKKTPYGNSLYRYYVPLLFLSKEGKTVIRKCRVLNIKDDKRYDTLSKNGWEVQYGQMIPWIIVDEGGHLKTKQNGSFNVEQFTLCGGVTNARFWDINLRYAQVASPLCDESETYAHILSKLNSWIQSLPEDVTRLYRHETRPTAKKEEQSEEQLD